MTETLYVLQNQLGGITSLCANLIRHRPDHAGAQNAIFLTEHPLMMPRAKGPLGADHEKTFSYSSQDNLYRVFDRLSKMIGIDPGPLVSNAGLELSLFSRQASARTIFQIVHDEYNVRLSQRYEPIIDVMIAHSRYIYGELLTALPHRRDSIFHLPYGVPLSSRKRAPNPAAPLHLVYLGRLAAGKGVHDLPKIEAALRSDDVPVRWTIIGDGPERAKLQEAMPTGGHVRYASPASNGEVLALCAEGDVFVFPTRFEGFPVALIEAMSAGLVPIASDIPSGIPEVIDAATGFLIPVGAVAGFAAQIGRLHRERSLLERMSVAAHLRVQDFEVAKRAADYHELFAGWAELKRPWSGPLPIKHGSRLDQPFLPNGVTRVSRRLIERIGRGPEPTSAS